MEAETGTIESLASRWHMWGAGIAGGLIGGIAMGVILHAGGNMMHLIGAFYGWPTVVGGWLAHLVNSLLIGLLFAAIVSRPVFRDQTATLGGCVILGVIYATVVGLVVGGILLPITLNATGAQALPAPLFPLPGLLGEFLVVISVGVAHLVYGILLGTTYHIVRNPSVVGPEPTIWVLSPADKSRILLTLLT